MWSGCLNARDIGGLPTKYGVLTRHGTVFRTDSPDNLDTEGRTAFLDAGAGLVLDLRSDWELTQPHLLDGSASYQRIPWIDPVADEARDASAERVLADTYRGSLDRNKAQVAKAFRALIDAPADAPVVVHCRSGKDRTGLLIALWLDLVGVPRDVIAADYAVSEERLGLVARLAELPDDERPAAEILWRTLPSTILDSLDHVDRTYGGVRSYLAACGLTEVEVHRLVVRLVPVDVRAVVFDFDGLLMDTETTMVESWRAEWAHHGLELDLSDFWPGHGGDITETRYELLAAAVGAGFDRAASHARRTAHRDAMHRELDFRPGIRAWISAARELGLKVAIASSSPRPWVHGHLERVGALEWFDEVVTGDEVAAHKPDPAIYELALRRLAVPGPQAIAVEDTAHGVAAAQATGMYAVAIPNPYVTPAAVEAADLVLTTAAQLPLTDLLHSASTPRN
ncbi:HAD-IA family hydrolase [Kribbella sp. NPDC050470]|uniref:HAD-IA family hydrolase n=1 Tax=unclassified Kribbella TaxID=2644121 RepID=UPI0037B0DBE0